MGTGVTDDSLGKPCCSKYKGQQGMLVKQADLVPVLNCHCRCDLELSKNDSILYMFIDLTVKTTSWG